MTMRMHINKQLLIGRSLMMICNRNKVLGVVALVGNSFILFRSIYLLYCYCFSSNLYLYKYPSWVLLKDVLLGSIGIYISVLVFKERIRFRSFLLLILLIWLLCLK